MQSFDLETRIFHEFPDAVIATTTQGEILYWNRAAEDMFGYKSQEAVGHLLNELIVPADRIEQENQLLHDAVVVGASTRETLRRKKDGSLVYVDISTRAIRDSDGNVQ